MTSLTQRSHVLAVLALTLSLALLVAGCGGSDDESSGGSGSGLAKAVPAEAAIYVEGVVRPDDAQKADIEQIAAHFPGGENIGQRILDEINKGFAEDAAGAEAPTFEADLDPWLGEHAAVYFKNASDDEPTGVIEVTDEAAAQAAIDKFAAADAKTETDSEEQGVKIKTDSEGDATAITDGFLLVGPEAGVKESIGILKGGDSLDGTGDFGDSLSRVEGEGALASLYLNVNRTIETAESDSDDPTPTDPADVRTFLEAAGFDTEKNVSVSLNTKDGDVTAQTSVPLEGSGGEATDSFDKLPGDAIVAASIPNLGESFGKGVEAGIKSASEEEGADAESIESQKGVIDSLVGFDVTQLGDVIGNGAFYVKGTNTSDIQGALIADIEDSEKATKAADAVKNLAGASGDADITDLSVPGATTAYTVKSATSPVPIEVAYTDEQLIIGAGTGAAAAALQPQQTLADSGALGDVESALDGEEPSSYVDVPKLLTLLQATGATADPDYPEIASYLAAFGQFAAGSSSEDGYTNSHAALTFTDAAPVVAPAPTAAEPKDEAPDVTSVKIRPAK